ncbi:MAG: hypothetical protein COU07_03450 [Candidatus Harrisonbacteria bacterium CG10_big_fil_rev_8_21_14_0_10_40_38]|uniref:Uncharacterized protein n=1 Tax=Candidatus Harrisonbacteria bacterium CG10_big_fil_rev_8_21_14_0_10_40_38 TaxID=1974583 RepID=A0A2H0UTF3_9BACT|nr:MAG: hypothetical protein COU07_03450 [Candidatus Harrisonbacteria bacterium CG10_big_fil_rev_8_21_14_0_10_40_38]
MIIHLYGTDSYRIKEKTDDIISEFIKRYPNSFPNKYSFSDKNSLDLLKTFVESQSLFNESRIAVFDSGEEAPKEVAPILKSILVNKARVLILISQKKMVSPFTFLYRDPVVSQTFKPLSGAELLAFVSKTAKQRGVALTPSAQRDIAESYLGDSWGIATELDKIALGGKFSKKNILGDFFPLVQTVAGGQDSLNRVRALTLLLADDDPAKIFNITAVLVRAPFKPRMADYDVAIKSGKLEYAETLLDFVLS